MDDFAKPVTAITEKISSRVSLKEQAPSASISVIVCTYGRPNALQKLVAALEQQTYQNFEILVIDGNEDEARVRGALERYREDAGIGRKLSILRSEKGLTRQRNVGLCAAQGEIICFLDDDVTFAPDFLWKVAEIFDEAEFQDVGGITPYDTLHYPTPLNLRWRLRAWLGVMPGSEPGKVDHLGRAVPLSFLKPWEGKKEIGWLPGFCMIYRRSAIRGLFFDELLPTYGGEDRDFSFQVGQRKRLLICGDLHLQHHYTVEGRDDGLGRLRESSFGVGRRFAKYNRGVLDYLTIARTFVGDFLVDMVAVARKPVPSNLLTAWVRIEGCVAGMLSCKQGEGRPANSNSSMKRAEISELCTASRERNE
jgi:glycosyltransferase involved in cell wall biosynthesis